MPNKYTGPMKRPPEHVMAWFDSGLTPGQIAVKEGRNPGSVRSLMDYWRKRMGWTEVKDKACPVKVAHVAHEWTAVSGKDEVTGEWGTYVHSMVDASTVLRVPGSRVGYFKCGGVLDVSGQRLKPRQVDNDGDLYIIEEHISRGNKVIRERLITLDAIYERTVTESPWVLVQQITCFCCTCSDYSSDWACRNHGYGFGMRPCDVHGTLGQREVNPETDEEGEMPDSVLVYRAKQRAVDSGNAD